jgi:mannose-1-phosphate guanylyltransferase
MNQIKTAVILVGGSGMRMRPFTEDMPKCMIPLRGKPLIHWTLEWLKGYGFEHAVLGVAYRKEIIIDYLKKHPVGLKVDFSEHSVEGETGEGFRLAIQRFVKDDNFLAMNGDEITSLDLRRLEELHLRSKAVATIAVSPMRSPFGILEIDGDDIIGFREKILLEAFPVLAQKRLLKACRLGKDEVWLTINSVKDLSVAEKEFVSIRRL